MSVRTPQFVAAALVQAVVQAVVLAGAVLLAGAASGAPSSAPSSADDPWSPRGAILRPAHDDRAKVVSPFQSCDVLLDVPEGACGVLSTANGQLAFTVEAGSPADDALASRPWVVRVYRESPEPDHANEFSVKLATRAQGVEVGPVYAKVAAAVGDVTGDGDPEVVVGFLSEGTGQILDIDIVTTSKKGEPLVLGHERIPKGVAEVKRGGLILWTSVYRKADANCCPTWIRRDVVRYRNGGFVVKRGPKVLTAEVDVPPGDFSETHDSTG